MNSEKKRIQEYYEQDKKYRRRNRSRYSPDWERYAYSSNTIDLSPRIYQNEMSHNKMYGHHSTRENHTEHVKVTLGGEKYLAKTKQNNKPFIFHTHRQRHQHGKLLSVTRRRMVQAYLKHLITK